MNSSQVIKMYGPSISDPAKIVNRDVPACDEQAYVRAGYKRGSVEEVSEPKPIVLPTEEVPLEEEDQHDGYLYNGEANVELPTEVVDRERPKRKKKTG